MSHDTNDDSDGPRNLKVVYSATIVLIQLVNVLI
jgi:hypothetical protein